MRFPLMVAIDVRHAVPDELPVFVRISGTDYVEGGWDVEQSIQFAKKLKHAEIDLIDCSSGALVQGVKIKVGPGYQVKIANEVKAKAGES